jgi:predicted metalloprotease with PDZ domain
VFRAGGVGAHFWLGENTRAKDLRHDWVGVHELSHLSLPFVRTSEPWLSEGVATYYQYLLQARAGWISESEFWYRLIEGIRSATSAPRESLRESATHMARTGAYRRVYWGGAALIWLADVTLRVRSDNGASLDLALERLMACCLPSERLWTAKALTLKLDELTDAAVFQQVFNAHLDEITPPPLDALLNNLGIVYGDNQVTLRDDAPWAHIRRSIVARVRTKDAKRR